MNEKFLAVGSTGAAFVASLCCIGPVVLGALGLGGAALSATFDPLRPYFLAATAVLLGLGFYAVYRRPKAEAACEGEVCAPDSRTRRAAKPLLWLATLAVLALALFPYYGGKLIGGAAANSSVASSAQLETVELKISGMTCEACAGTVKYALNRTLGVAEAEVEYPAGRATVKYDPTLTDTAKVIEAVNATGYRAEISGPSVRD
jgi:mercuric ion transport protein